MITVIVGVPATPEPPGGFRRRSPVIILPATKGVKPQASGINLPLDIGLHGQRHLQKIAVEFA
jgi:hypothetical protein